MRSTTWFRSAAALGSALLREPLLHFVLLGGLVFAVDHVLAARRDDPSVIVVRPEVEAEARSIFRGAQGRDPTQAELEILREHWIDTEVLYREGLALRLEQGDQALRDRVIFKAMNVIESNLRVPEADEDTLREWFEAHRARYDTPARFDFSEALPAGKPDETRMRQFADALNRGAETDVQSGLRIFEKRPRQTIADSFGPEFADELDRVPLLEWQVLPSVAGPRIIRLAARQEGSSVSFETVRGRVLLDWKDAKAQELRTAAVRELSKKYTIRLAESSS